MNLMQVSSKHSFLLSVYAGVVDGHRFDADPDPDLDPDWHQNNATLMRNQPCQLIKLGIDNFFLVPIIDSPIVGLLISDNR